MARRTDNARRLVKKVSSGVASVYYCPFCPRPAPADDGLIRFNNGRGYGRGHGLRCGAIGTAKVGAHIRKHHPEQIQLVESA